ncbi:ABC transporter [Terrabacter sp. Root85]|uniref:GTPase n=1 Tax=unclassified Terrabacter TaxID=2630222 RepID=UPI0006FB4A65|nr:MULTISPECIES: GTPase [unclassified Terrabacter]KRC85264.1 ABC transporter [Terrabacter sp. Root85]KRF44435.1 ABC transporter [Terrabacter sp. Soil811]
MSPIRMGRARVATVSAAELGTRTTELSMALVSGADELDPSGVEVARRVVDRAVERSGIAGDHTVVALAGATGSGKSSLFNALVGADVATIGARRPTTSRPTAGLWGDADASELLEWLGVASRHVVESSAGAGDRPVQVAGSLDGLVLLDLPDFDSRELEHRREAERVLELVDVFVWVTDPQKYADARLHDEFVSLLSHHDAVTLGVLNQADRLTAEGVKVLTQDLTKLLVADGVADAKVLATSALTGQGIPELKQRLANAVAGHAASRQRLKADVVGAATKLRPGVADSEADVGRVPREALDTSLARAAGVPIVLDAVARDYRREAFAHTGWLFARWTKGFASDPLRRLRLDRTGGRPPIPVEIDGADVRAVLGRSSIPAPTVSTASAVDLATRSFVRDASEGLPVRWAQAVEDAVDGGDGALSDSLDRAVIGTSLRARRPVWWFVVNILQWVLGLVALAGLIWYAVLWGFALLQLPRPETPAVGILPLPLVMLVVGVLIGVGLGILSRWWARVGARHRRTVVGKRLTESVAAVADEHILIPVDEVLLRHRETREHLEAAAG